MTEQLDFNPSNTSPETSVGDQGQVSAERSVVVDGVLAGYELLDLEHDEIAAAVRQASVVTDTEALTALQRKASLSDRLRGMLDLLSDRFANLELPKEADETRANDVPDISQSTTDSNVA